jgi:hypothetical protein
MDTTREHSTVRLTDKQIAQYQAIYQKVFGRPVSKGDALMQGMALVRLVKAIATNVNDEELKDGAISRDRP